MAIDPNIKQKAENIRLKKKGREVRESLAAGLEAMSEDVVSTVARQGNVEGQFQEVIDNTTGKDVISAPELIAARNGEANLKARLDKEQQQVNAQLAHKIGMGVKATPEDLSAETLGLITGEGGPVNLLSIPQDYSVSPIKTDFIQTPINLFNKDDPRNQYGKLLNTSSGNIIDLAGGVISHPIEIKSGQTVTAYFNPLSFGGNARIFCYMENNTYIGSFAPTMNGQIGTFTIPENPYEINYMLINVSKEKMDSTMVVLGDNYPEKYLSHEYKLKENFALNDRQLNQIPVNESPLQGKNVVFDGDSIMNAVNDHLDGWAGRIAGKYNMSYTNYAVDGGTITGGLLTSGGSERHSVARTVPDYRADADYIILEGGTNDADLIGLENMGEISVGFDATLDDTTFTGAVEKTLKQVILKYPGKKIGFIIAHKMGGLDQQKVRKAFFDRIMECCRKWGIPYLNLWETWYANPLIPEIKIRYYSDNQHLTTLGYDDSTHIIEKWMESL